MSGPWGISVGRLTVRPPRVSLAADAVHGESALTVRDMAVFVRFMRCGDFAQPDLCQRYWTHCDAQHRQRWWFPLLSSRSTSIRMYLSRRRSPRTQCQCRSCSPRDRLDRSPTPIGPSSRSSLPIFPNRTIRRSVSVQQLINRSEDLRRLANRIQRV